MEHGFEPLSPFAQGLGTGVAGGIAGVATTGKPAQQEPFVQGLAMGAAGGPAESITAGNQVAQPVTNDNAARNFFAVEHGFEPLSPFEQGLQGTNDGNTPAPASVTETPAAPQDEQPQPASPYSSEVKKLEDAVALLEGMGAASEAIASAQGALDRQKEYEDKSRTILSDNTLDSWNKNILLQKLDVEYGKRELAGNATVRNSGTAASPANVKPPAADTVYSPETQRLADTLADMKAKNAPYEAITSVEKELEKRKLADTIKYMKTKNAPYEAVTAAEQSLEKLINPPVELPELDRKRNEYQAKRAGLQKQLSGPNVTTAKIADIQNAINALDKQYKDVRIIDESNAKLKSKIDSLNLEKDLLKKAIERGDYLEIEERTKNVNYITAQFGPDMQGLLKGDAVDIHKVADIKLSNLGIGNARYENGVATGNMEDVVKGFGGSVSWNKGKDYAVVKDADGNVVSTFSVVGGMVTERDKDGKVTGKGYLSGGQVQMDITKAAEKMGVPLSCYHDKNGVFHAYVQPEMRGQPIQVMRREDQVTIEVYAYFNYVGPKPKTQAEEDAYKATVKAAYDTMSKTWDTGKYYELCGINTAGDSDKVQLHTKIHAASNCGQIFTDGIPAGHKAMIINLDKDSVMTAEPFNWSSHVFTLNPKDPAFTRGLIETAVDKFGNNPAMSAEIHLAEWLLSGEPVTEIQRNIEEALKTKQYEKAMYNWRIDDPGQVWLYNPTDAGHELQHPLGLGDAYAAIYRENKEAGDTFTMNNEYGHSATYTVPRMGTDQQGNVVPGDIARSESSSIVTDTDVALIVNLIWRYGTPFYYEKK